jgi:hypothetical protein
MATISPGLEADGRSGALSAPFGAETFTIAGAAVVFGKGVVGMVLIPGFKGIDDVRHRPKAQAEPLMSLHN